MTRPWRALLLCLTTLLLLGQSVAAPAHCLRLARPAVPGGLALPLCTPEGLRWVVHATIAEDEPPPGEGVPSGTTPDHAEPGFCPACHGLPDGIALPAGPALPSPRWALLRAAPPPLPAALPPGLPRGPPGGPRGPPALA